MHDSRGLTQGRVFSHDGALVASVAQEVFLRRPRPELLMPAEELAEGRQAPEPRPACLTAALVLCAGLLPAVPALARWGHERYDRGQCVLGDAGRQVGKRLREDPRDLVGPDALHAQRRPPRRERLHRFLRHRLACPYHGREDHQGRSWRKPLALVSSFKRSDGVRQVLYNKHALYTFEQDTGPGMLSGQGVTTYGGVWWVVSATGKAVTGQ